MSHFLVIIHASSDASNHVENVMGHEEFNAGGARYDTFEIGGAWKKLFLIPKSSMTDCGHAEENDAPEGYLWTPYARKRDIAWAEMDKITCPASSLPVTAFIQDGTWHSIDGGMEWNSIKPEAWGLKVEAYIASLSPDEFLFGIDCHGYW